MPYTARVTRQTKYKKIVKDEITTEALSELLEMLDNNYYDEENILEIHIIRG